MGKLFKIAMFITSFIPLWITVIFIDAMSILKSSTNIITEIVGTTLIIIVNICSIIIILKSLSSIENSEYRPYIVLEASQEKGITSEFLLAYVLPLFAFDFTRWDSTVQFLIYFSVLSFLCIRNNNVYANLIFEIKNFKFYDCELQWKPEMSTKPIKAMVISKKNLSAESNNTIRIAVLNKPFHVMKM